MGKTELVMSLVSSLNGKTLAEKLNTSRRDKGCQTLQKLV